MQIGLIHSGSTRKGRPTILFDRLRYAKCGASANLSRGLSGPRVTAAPDTVEGLVL